MTEEARWRRTLDALRRVLRGEETVDALLARRRRDGPGRETVPGPPKVSVDNRLSDTHTVVEVKCPDRVGLLYAITRTLSEQGSTSAAPGSPPRSTTPTTPSTSTDRQGRRVEDAGGQHAAQEALEDALMKPL